MLLYNKFRKNANTLDKSQKNCYSYDVKRITHYKRRERKGRIPKKRKAVYLMKKATIRLSTINDVKNFVSKVSLCDFDVDLISGRYAVDAKSIMGIFSLDLEKTIDLEAHTDNADEFFAAIKQYIVE